MKIILQKLKKFFGSLKMFSVDYYFPLHQTPEKTKKYYLEIILYRNKWSISVFYS
jgi:hypothetical protein